MRFGTQQKLSIPKPEDCLPGRQEKMPIPEAHEVLGTPLNVDSGQLQKIFLGMGCFWGAERLFWRLPGVYSTAVGYAGGITPNPTYEEVCSGLTGHTEVVQVVFDSNAIALSDLLTKFWEEHDPTQGFRQGNDLGTQYRSAIYCTSQEQEAECHASLQKYQEALVKAGKSEITSEVKLIDNFYFAEPYHQQYLAKNPNGYCGLAGTGIKCIP
ncbi:peptide-methionine (S)-S-oxide reductase MsrA [Halioxenophilus sp. WMMB6]|uniref:peptide-methionine (S)-S-oxide reductase MsrA n=1 Tax=Halioxenophilus sp. WMMB6 TaxID=3073815 RepID=UPI00295E48CF|nr:peptide-methionine (S)-S-oxide reductase MsrA [Halioxenophilus sp. WMMB6]